jgi:uncharacterized membrane protein YfcA
MTESLAFWAIAALSSLFVGASKGGLPAVALLSVPLLSLVMPPMLGAALILPVYLISDVYGLWIYRKSYSRRNLAILLPAGLLGISIGWALAESTNENAVRLVVGITGLGFVALRLWQRFQGATAARRADVPRGVFWGTISGFTSFVAHAGGPAFQIYVLPQHLGKMTFAGTSTILFALLNLAKLPPYIALGFLHWDQTGTILALAPIALAGAWIGYRLTLIIPEKAFFLLVEGALLVISVLLIRAGLGI